MVRAVCRRAGGDVHQRVVSMDTHGGAVSGSHTAGAMTASPAAASVRSVDWVLRGFWEKPCLAAGRGGHRGGTTPGRWGAGRSAGDDERQGMSVSR